MAKYIFNFKAIALTQYLTAHNNQGVWSVSARNIEKAIEKAEEHFKTNAQFRFTYEYVGKDTQ